MSMQVPSWNFLADIRIKKNSVERPIVTRYTFNAKKVGTQDVDSAGILAHKGSENFLD